MLFSAKEGMIFSFLTALMIFRAVAGVCAPAPNAPNISKLEDFHTPVYVYTPKGAGEGAIYPLLFVLPDPGSEAEKTAQLWSDFPRNVNAYVAVPDLKMKTTDLPYQTDAWLLKVKKDLAARYQVPETEIYLIGEGEVAGHYAAYLGMKYPEEFSAAALLGGAWSGNFSKLVQPSERAVKQIPFFVALPGGETERFKTIEDEALRLSEKGYKIHVEKVGDAKEFQTREFKKILLPWLKKAAQDWVLAAAESRKSRKERIRSAIQQFFDPK